VEFRHFGLGVAPTSGACFGVSGFVPLLTALAFEVLPVTHTAGLLETLFSSAMGAFDRGIGSCVWLFYTPAMAATRANEDHSLFAVLNRHTLVFFGMSTLGASFNIMEYLPTFRTEHTGLTIQNGDVVFQVEQART
jgi:hypothetical protein